MIDIRTLFLYSSNVILILILVVFKRVVKPYKTMKQTLFTLILLSFSTIAQSASYFGVDYVNYQFKKGGESHAAQIGAGMTINNNIAVEGRMSFDLAGSNLSSGQVTAYYNDIEQTPKASETIKQRFSVEYKYSLLFRGTARVTDKFSLYGVAGVSQYSVLISPDFQQYNNEVVFGPEVGFGFNFLTGKGSSIHLEATKLRNFLSSEAYSGTLGFRTAF